MNDTREIYPVRIPMTDRDFKSLSVFIHSKLGIKMTDVKKGMVESRLRKRLVFHGFRSYSEYCDYLFSKEGSEQELPDFIDVITTNKTDFFREPHHFKFMMDKALPDLKSRTGAGVERKLRVWSCACSRGDEPYTLAMVLTEFGERVGRFDFSILATDISTRILETAVEGIYDMSIIEPIPMDYRKKYLMRSKDPSRERVRIRPELRQKIAFRELNLMDSDFRIRQKMDILFCRNVIIYFDKPTTEKLLVKLCAQIQPGGYLFMGHSELLDCGLLPLIPVAPTVYQKKG
jgi:chemotaxis protein methyltransferase CheR